MKANAMEPKTAKRVHRQLDSLIITTTVTIHGA